MAPEVCRDLKGGAAKISLWNKRAYQNGTLLSREYLPHVLAARKAVPYDGHVGERNGRVEQTRIDPRAASYGVDVLVLLQRPSGEASDGSGFIRRDNYDPTASNSTIVAEDTGLLSSRS